MPEQEERIRTIAGYLLKNNARLILNASPEIAMYVKASVLQAFTDTSIMIRNAAGQDVVAFLGALEPKNWPECLQQLVSLLDSPELDRQEVSHFGPWHHASCVAGRIRRGVTEHPNFSHGPVDPRCWSSIFDASPKFGLS